MSASQVVLVVENLPANARDITDVKSLIPELERSPGGGHGNPSQYSCLENPKDQVAWRATVHRIAESGMTEMTWQARTRAIYINHAHAYN